MSGQRALPPQASLRYLKLEAKRRLAAGEFAALHEAQLAIAREHGLPSWTALKHAIAAAHRNDGHALAQLRWIISRFGEAGAPGWAAPGEAELREHFADGFLATVPPEELVAMIVDLGAELREELIVTGATPFTAQGKIGGQLVAAATESSPPHRLTAVRLRRLGARISDPRTASPRVAISGEVPAPVPAMAVSAVAELGLPGLALAGGATGQDRSPGPVWSAATGWADLEDAEVLRTGHRFPAYQITTVITAVAVLRLVGDGRLGLDDAANRHLRTVRLSDDAVTVRELLLHTGGVEDPPALFAPSVPGLIEVTGPVLACTGDRGAFDYSHAGYAALGQLLSHLTGWPYTEAVSRLVLRPLGMNRSWYPESWPSADAVTGYDVTPDGSFKPLPGSVCVFPAAGGLWVTAGDLARFGLAWSSLLPRALAGEALRPQAVRPTGASSGLGWIVNKSAGLAGHAGDGPCGVASLLVPLSGGHVQVALANRQILVEPFNAEVLRAVGAGAVPTESVGAAAAERDASTR
jgi:CubicO group peptidase (beta-lactamase class C family)